ncbi:Ig-like domain-containing protein [Bdellovibrionales bacterium]|nr:Ig-like domain-containing protein [Bdellovibrionales bacterium]
MEKLGKILLIIGGLFTISCTEQLQKVQFSSLSSVTRQSIKQYSINEDMVLEETLADKNQLLNGSYTIVKKPASGNLELLDSHSGAFKYTPPKNFFGELQFEYKIEYPNNDNDNDDAEPQARYGSIMVLPVNDMPFLNQTIYQVPDGKVLKFVPRGR